MRFPRATALSAWAAHVLAWAVGAWLAFGPVYQGVSATLPGESPDDAARFTATLIEVNGLRVVPLLLVPVLLSGIAVWAVKRPHAGMVGRGILLWVLAVVLLGLCAVSILSIGMLYLPVALALLVAAITGSAGRARGGEGGLSPAAPRRQD